MNKYDKAKVGDIAFLDAGTRESDNKCGEVIRVIPSGGPDAPHIRIKTLNGAESDYDYDEVSPLGRPRAARGLAMIKVLSDPDHWRETKGRTSTPWKEDEHRQWPILAVAGVTDAASDRRWALVEDPYTKRGHWMQKNQPYMFYTSDVDQVTVLLEGIPPDL